MKSEKKKKNFWYWVFLIIIILIILYFYGNYKDKWEKENCELTFTAYTYDEGCSSTCSIKCSNEGFSWLSSSYFESYLSYEEMTNPNLYKSCGCNCGGCRE